jgi:hypothetical protein
MAIGNIDKSQRDAARIVGLAFPISFATVVAVNFGVFAGLIVRDNPGETARNILAHETLFRIGVAGNLVYCVGVVVLLTALYVILRPVSRNLAMLAAFGRLIHGLTWLLVSVNLFTAFRLLSNADYQRSLGSEHAQSLAQLFLSGSDEYYVGLLFWALSGTAGSFLWLKSKYVPGPLAAFGLISSAWCAACTFVFYIFPDFSNVVNLWWFDSPMAVFELVLSIWLLVKGLRPAAWAGSNEASG